MKETETKEKILDFLLSSPAGLAFFSERKMKEENMMPEVLTFLSNNHCVLRTLTLTGVNGCLKKKLMTTWHH